ncbi:MAG: ssDNA-binding domain-containing protein [Bacteroidetes bacterium]|nr:ssDNA-binding domain-containing protein [Bacteroidota bacterium]
MKNEVVFEEITRTVIAQIEKGVAPWRMNWGFVEPPQNYFSGHKYRGINAFLIFLKQYPTPFFATFNQIIKNGGKVKKGSKAHRLYFSKSLWYDSNGNQYEETDLEYLPPQTLASIRRVYYIKYDMVFNMSDVEGIELRPFSTVWNENDSFLEIDNFINVLTDKPQIQVKLSNNAYYDKVNDLVNMPLIHQFYNSADFYATAFHELVHSSGHAKRLNRATLRDFQEFGDANYSKEELIAELGACFMCNHFGIDNVDVQQNAAAYLQGWLKTLKAEPRMLWEAAADAQRAFDFFIKQTISKA